MIPALIIAGVALFGGGVGFGLAIERERSQRQGQIEVEAALEALTTQQSAALEELSAAQQAALTEVAGALTINDLSDTSIRETLSLAPSCLVEPNSPVCLLATCFAMQQSDRGRCSDSEKETLLSLVQLYWAVEYGLSEGAL